LIFRIYVLLVKIVERLPGNKEKDGPKGFKPFYEGDMGMVQGKPSQANGRSV